MNIRLLTYISSLASASLAFDIIVNTYTILLPSLSIPDELFYLGIITSFVSTLRVLILVLPIASTLSLLLSLISLPIFSTKVLLVDSYLRLQSYTIEAVVIVLLEANSLVVVR